MRKVGSAVVVPIVGPLFKRGDMFTELFGDCTYENIREQLQAALASDAELIVLDVDSPGGDALGCADLAEFIFENREKIVAVINGQCCSASYYLASAASRMVADRGAMIGSIGTRVLMVDGTAAEMAAGFRCHMIVSEASPDKAPDASQAVDRARVQEMVDELGRVFVADVAKHRSVTVAKVLSDFGRGDVFIGEAALGRGMIDEIGNLDSVLAEFGEAQERRAQMAKPNAAPKATMDEEQCDECGRNMDGGDACYCQSCFDSEAESIAAAGLDPKASHQTFVERVKGLVQFEADAQKATGTASAAAALGKISAGAEAIAERDQLRASIEAEKATATQTNFRAAIDQAIESKRLGLGIACRVIPALMGEGRAAAAKAVGELQEQTKASVLDALCVGSVSADALEGVRAFIDAQSPMLEAHQEPAGDQENKGVIIAVSKGEASKFGLKSESVEKYLNVHSVAQIAAPQKERV